MSADTILIVFDRNGHGRSFYTEAIPFAVLGWLRIERVTTIEWDCASQVWHVLDMQGCKLFQSTSRAACLEWERAHFNLDIEN